MHEKARYELYIGAYSPETIPMDRLGAYMQAFARALGTREQPTFGGMEAGSTRLIARVEWADSFEVDGRLTSQSLSEELFSNGFKEINDLLIEDNATGCIVNSRQENVVNFPGVRVRRAPSFSSFRETATIRGQLVRIGGTDETVHATLLDGERSVRCTMTRAMAREVANLLFGPTLRVSGSGRYERDGQGNWNMKSFDAERFEVLDGSSLSETILSLRNLATPGLRGLEAYSALIDAEDEKGMLR